MNKPLLTASLAAFVFIAAPCGAADVAAGKALADGACVDCHGDDGKGDADFPGITGLSEGDFAKAMQEYADGTRNESPKMTKVAKKLSAEQIADLAAYYATLK
jgi:cytochrome c553